MTTPAEQMKFIVEKTPGMCWHKPKPDFRRINHSMIQKECVCGASSSWEKLEGHGNPKPIFRFNNPSPTDLNALMEIARKLFIVKEINFIYDHGCVGDAVHCCLRVPAIQHLGTGDTEADALRLAIFKSLGGEDTP